jgi:acyl-coenzyme A thioesterase PaaI-like protein
MFFSKTFSAAAVLALASSVAAVLKTEFVNHAVVTLDLNARHVVPVPGGTKLGE